MFISIPREVFIDVLVVALSLSSGVQALQKACM